MKGRKTSKRKHKFDWNKFWKKFAIRAAYRAMEISILLAAGWALGLKLVKY